MKNETTLDGLNVLEEALETSTIPASTPPITFTPVPKPTETDQKTPLADVPRTLLKFAFFDQMIVPEGIPNRGEHDNRAKGPEVYRDDGRQVLEAHNVDAANMRRSLVNNNFLVTDYWATTKKEPNKKKLGTFRVKTTVTIKFERAYDLSPEREKAVRERQDDPALIDGLRYLAQRVWADCFVWANPTTEKFGPGSVTINLRTPREEGYKPQAELYVEGRVLHVRHLLKKVPHWLPERKPAK